MRNAFSLAFAVVVLALGGLFGALNPVPVRIDLYFEQFDLSLGSALLLAALLGALAGGLCLGLAVILPQQRRLRRLQRAVTSHRQPEASASSVTTAGA